MPEVLVVGGGAAGMAAALFASRGGASVTLLEKNEKLGKKVSVRGEELTLSEFARLADILT